MEWWQNDLVMIDANARFFEFGFLELLKLFLGRVPREIVNFLNTDHNDKAVQD
jgi:hypothetical protein